MDILLPSSRHGWLKGALGHREAGDPEIRLQQGPTAEELGEAPHLLRVSCAGRHELPTRRFGAVWRPFAAL